MDKLSGAPRTEALIVNLDSAPGRMAFQAAQAARLGLSARRVAAVMADAVDPDELAAMSRRNIRPFRPAELACLLSHARCWEMVVAEGAPRLVLEDDAVVSERLPEVLDALAAAFPDDVVNLETFRRHPKLLRRAPCPGFDSAVCRVFPVIKGTAGAAAYLVGPAAAARLLSNLHRHPRLADHFLGSCAGRPSLQTIPALGVQFMTLESDYGADFGGLGASTIRDRRAARDTGRLARWLERNPAHPRYVARRVQAEWVALRSKILARLFGQTTVIPPCPTILAHLTERNQAWSS